MSGISPILVRVLGDNTSLRAVLRTTTSDIDKATKDWNDQTSRSQAAFKLLNTTIAAVGATAAGLTVAAVTMSASFEQRMRNVNSIAKLSEGALKDLSQQVLDLAKTLPVGANDLADALYQIESSGIGGADAVKVLTASAKAGVAGLTSTANAATAVTAAINAYGLSANDASDVSDILFQTVNLGVIDFDTLSRNLGMVVGNASAAKVPLQDVGAALATMTLSGQSSSIATTSLNSLLTKLAVPGKDLAAVYKSLGYSSGEAALKQEGLLGVIGDLRTVTGGSLSGLQRLLHDQEAVRGATALMTQQGQLYAGVQAQIADKSGRTGATQAALNEQLKATTARFQLLVAGARAYGIEQGLKLLPSVNQLLEAVGRLAVGGTPKLEAAFTHVLPVLRALASLGVNLGKVLLHLAQEVAPLVGALGSLAGRALIAGITALVQVLSSAVGVLADHPQIIEAIVAIIVARLIPGLVASAAAAAISTVQFYRLGASMALTSVRSLGLAGATSKAAAALGGYAAIASTLGWAAVILALVAAWKKLNDVEKDAKGTVDSVTKSFDALDTASATKVKGQLTELAAGASPDEKSSAEGTALGRTLVKHGLVSKETLDNLDEFSHSFDAAFGVEGAKKVVVGDEAAKQLKTVNAAIKNTNSNVSRLARQFGVSEGVVRSFAKANDVDLSKPYKDSADEVIKLRTAITGAASESGTSVAALAAAAGGVGDASAQAITDLAAAVKSLQDATASAVGSATDVLGTVTPGASEEAVASANKALSDAQAKLADVRKAYADVQVLPASAAKKIADATAEVSTAAAAQAKATKDARSNTLEGAYADAISQTTTFSADITKALEQGLDPTVVAKLLAEGPKQAGPILEQIVGDHSGRLVKLVNDSEEQITKISAFTVEQARLTALAVGSSTDQLSHDLPEAMKLAASLAGDQAGATADVLARTLGVPTDEVLRVAQEYGITLGQAVAKGVQAGVGGLSPGVTFEQPATRANPLARQAGFAGGGYVLGPGTTTSDSIVAHLSTKEYVMQASAVARMGLPFMHAVNSGLYRPPGFARGGFAGAPTQRVVTVPVPVHSTHTASAPIQIEHLHAVDVADFEVQAARRRRLAAMNTPVGA